MWTSFWPNSNGWRMNDEAYMALALVEARKGNTSPNPRVGAVIVDPKTERVVASGFHARAGEPHAEVNAIAAAAQTEGATIYVTLEPCDHHGKTPPCTEAIVAARFGRVVIGATDPTGHARGSIEKLRAAGMRVDVGVLRAECEQEIADFSKYTREKKPWVTLKAALTLDGKYATASHDSKWITGEAARDHAHRLRAEHDAIMVGVTTVVEDDPRLTTRRVEGDDPLRVIVDGALRSDPAAAVYADDNVLVFCASDAPAARADAFDERGIARVSLPGTVKCLELLPGLEHLAKRSVMRLLVEGGPTLHSYFLSQGQVDEAAIFVAPKIVGDPAAPGLDFKRDGRTPQTIAGALSLRDPAVTVLGQDVLFRGKV